MGAAVPRSGESDATMTIKTAGDGKAYGVEEPNFAPDAMDAAMQAARRAEARRLSTAKGRRSTFLTSETGVVIGDPRDAHYVTGKTSMADPGMAGTKSTALGDGDPTAKSGRPFMQGAAKSASLLAPTKTKNFGKRGKTLLGG